MPDSSGQRPKCMVPVCNNCGFGGEPFPRAQLDTHDHWCGNCGSRRLSFKPDPPPPGAEERDDHVELARIALAGELPPDTPPSVVARVAAARGFLAGAEERKCCQAAEQQAAKFFREALDETDGMELPHAYHMLRVKVASRISALTGPPGAAQEENEADRG